MQPNWVDFKNVSLWKLSVDKVRTTLRKNIRLLERTGKKRFISWIMNFANHLYLTENLQFGLSWPLLRWALLERVNASRYMCFGKLHFTTISRENATDLKLSTRAFALPWAHIPFIQLEEQRNALNVSTPSEKVPLTPEVRISLRAHFCYRFHVMRPPTVIRTTLKGKLRCFNVRASFVCRMLLNYITINPWAALDMKW